MKNGKWMGSLVVAAVVSMFAVSVMAETTTATTAATTTKKAVKCQVKDATGAATFINVTEEECKAKSGTVVADEAAKTGATTPATTPAPAGK